MEKYRVFSDSSTCSNPFVPFWSNTPNQFIHQVVYVFIKLPFSLIKLVLLFIVFIYFLCVYFLSYLFIFPILRKYFEGVCYYVGGRIALLLCGFWQIQTHQAVNRRLRPNQPGLFPSPSSSSSSPCSLCFNRIPGGTLLLCNYTSFVEILFMITYVNPIYTILSADGSVEEVSLFGALRHSFRFTIGENKQQIRNTNSRASIVHICKHATKPVLLFPEGAKTNGSAVLRWLPFYAVKGGRLEGREQQEESEILSLLQNRCILVGFGYDLNNNKKSLYTPPHTVNSPFFHLLFLCAEFWHNLSIEWISPDFVRSFLAATPAVKQQRTDSPVPVVAEALRGLLASLVLTTTQGSDSGGVGVVDVGGERLIEFVNYWNNTYKKKYI